MSDTRLTQNNGIANTNEAPKVSPDASDSSNLGINFSKDIREVVGKLPHENQGGSASKQQQRAPVKSPQERKEELLSRLPKDPEKAERFMRKEIERTLESQLHHLESRLSRPGSYFDMNNIMSHIREFREILSQIASMAFDQLKALWLRFVHNLSI